MQNPKPSVYKQFTLSPEQKNQRSQRELDETEEDPVDPLEIFQLIRHINDPEYPLTLEQLNVVNIERCSVQDDTIKVLYTPTIPHCSMAQMIGLMLKVKLIRSVGRRYKTEVRITPGTHVNQNDINKQLRDKERVAAAIENTSIMKIIRKGIHNSDRLFIG